MTACHDVLTPDADPVLMKPDLGWFAITPRRRGHPPLALIAGLLAMALALPALIVNAAEGPAGSSPARGNASTVRLQPVVAKDWLRRDPAARRDP